MPNSIGFTPEYQNMIDEVRKQIQRNQQKQLESTAQNLARRGTLTSPVGTPALTDVQSQFSDQLNQIISNLGLQQAGAQQQQSQYNTTLGEGQRQFNTQAELEKQKLALEQQKFNESLKLAQNAQKQQRGSFIGSLVGTGLNLAFPGLLPGAGNLIKGIAGKAFNMFGNNNQGYVSPLSMNPNLNLPTAPQAFGAPSNYNQFDVLRALQSKNSLGGGN